MASLGCSSRRRSGNGGRTRIITGLAALESVSPTAWVPESKPIWFTEFGCPAVDKGSNQPNVFIDPKSSESFAPFFSRRSRDDLIQRRYIQALQSFFDPADEDYIAGSNPNSSVYGGRMVDRDRLYVYTWDARPYPAFPYALSVWADGGNWELGHWLTGRVGGGSLAAVVAKILEDYGFTSFDVGGLDGFVEGFVIDRIMAAREALQPLSLAYFFDAYESGGLIHFAQRGRIGNLANVTPDDLVEISCGRSALHADARSGDGAAALGEAQLYRRRSPLCPGRGRGAAAQCAGATALPRPISPS